ncbi:MAG TPA: type I DNA topoisomerase, partial [Gammaproteobacteria bacterium]|nr:type I DNA topoisomerase [Gammaproteobacteria bacterium]
DREGEAISWHLLQELKPKIPVKRMVFHEITREAITEALAHPREVDEKLVRAQETRRILDRLVGYTLSPLLWKKIAWGLSAGRVQSVAVRLLVQRERERRAFRAGTYWDLKAALRHLGQGFEAQLVSLDGRRIATGKDFDEHTGRIAEGKEVLLLDEKTAASLRERLAASTWTVISTEEKPQVRRPWAPFTTSTLQQEANRKLRLSARETMRVAQNLYEQGFITYMRTDSVHLSNQAITAARELIDRLYGKEFLAPKPRHFSNKAAHTQEAHEAIRPAGSHFRTPEETRLGGRERDLYELIWKRTLACQMIHATIDTVGVNLHAGEENIFRASGSTVVNPGFMSVYQESVDDEKKDDEESGMMLPKLIEGEKIDLISIRPEQHFTEPPPRFTEATLVKALEAFGIGRPSTYASIIDTLEKREYVTLDKRRFTPTDVGRVVNKFLSEHFHHYVDYEFTARMEDDLDEISRGEKEWRPLLQEFWGDFQTQVKDKENVDRPGTEILEEPCPKCGKKLSKRLGRNGYFIGCTGYPECDYTRNVDEDAATAAQPQIVEGRMCPKCGSQLIIKRGRYGKFIGCSGYPNCKHMEPLEKPADTGVECPECKQATMLKRKSRYGKVFYSCARYPDCKYAVWNLPLKEPCPKCGWPITTIKITKRRGTEKVCPIKECGFAEPYEGEVPGSEPQAEQG